VKRVLFVMALGCMTMVSACKRNPEPHVAPAASVAPSASIAAPATLVSQPPVPVAPPAPVTGENVLPAKLGIDDSIDAVRKRFGAINVELGQVPGAEELVPGAILYPHDPTRRLYLYFHDDQMRALSMVRVLDDASRWRLPSGVHMGMPLSEIVERNGARIQFSGFGWDYGGTISNWNNGHLQPMPGQGRFSLRTREGLPDSVALPQGEGEVWSDDPKYPTLGRDVVVGELVYGFPKRL
jgi:hypothetical protein